MNNVSEKITEQALSLPSNERIALVEEILKSLNLPIQSDIDKLWAAEAEKRVEELNNRKVKPIPGDKVFNEIRARFGK